MKIVSAVRSARIVKIATGVIHAPTVKIAITAKDATPAKIVMIVFYARIVKTALIVKTATLANPAVTAEPSKVKRGLKTSGASSYFAASYNIKGEVLCQLSCFHIKKIWLSRLLRS